jgi:hypothetical protein
VLNVADSFGESTPVVPKPRDGPEVRPASSVG